MKRIGKSIISWMCMLIMTIGMIVPVMAEVKIGGIQIFGFFTMLPICSMEVPSP